MLHSIILLISVVLFSLLENYIYLSPFQAGSILGCVTGIIEGIFQNTI